MNIILTGGTRGIGYATAVHLLEEGHTLTISYVRSDSIAEEMQKRFPRNLRCLKASITEDEDNRKLLSLSERTFGSIDVLINNAGTSLYGLLSDMTEEEIRQTMDINVTGTLSLTRQAIPYLLKSKGQIINIGSIWGHKGASCEVVYAMTKGALHQMTTSLARELGPSGVRVNTISPGLIRTEMNDELELGDFLESIPLKRMGEPEEVARLVSFLIKSTYISGADLRIDGGYGI